jgi:adenine-specific DNA-methyltransferase
VPKLTRAAIVYSRRLRSGQTDAERALWRALRLRQFSGYKFRRQHPVGHYIVDFASVEAGLCIEVDGSQHQDAKQYDDERTAFLESRGLMVLRFWDNEVLTQIESVKQAIWNALQHKKPPPPCPYP